MFCRPVRMAFRRGPLELLPLLNQPAYIKTFGNLENKYPVAKMINQRGFYFGCHPYMTKKDIHHISKTIHEFLSK